MWKVAMISLQTATRWSNRYLVNVSGKWINLNCLQKSLNDNVTQMGLDCQNIWTCYTVKTKSNHNLSDLSCLNGETGSDKISLRFFLFFYMKGKKRSEERKTVKSIRAKRIILFVVNNFLFKYVVTQIFIFICFHSITSLCINERIECNRKRG